MHVDPKTGKVVRKCHRCKKFVDMKNFHTDRIKTCIPCQIEQRLRAVKMDEHTRTLVPIDKGLPALTSTREGRNKYNRERNRRAREADSQPPPAAKSASAYKTCRTCHKLKPAIEFASQHVRICKACDGPPLG